MKWLALIFLTILNGCTAWNSANSLEKDLNAVCSAQKSYLQTARLSGVNQAELWAERARIMRADLSTNEVKAAVEEFLAPGGEGNGKPFFDLATNAKLTQWSCPEFELARSLSKGKAKK